MRKILITSLLGCAALSLFGQEKKFDKDHTVDYLVVYDMSNPGFIESRGGREAYAQEVVDSINVVLRNSDINYCFRLAGVHYLDGYKAANIESGLNDLTNNLEVQKKRRETKADIVVLLTESFGDVNSGLADHRDDAIHPQAYSSVNLSMAASAYTAAHEAGHILGGYHSRSEYEQAPSTHPWAAAYISPKGYRTVLTGMAPGTTVPIFSGPNSVWNGEVMGDERHDNVRMILHNLPRVVHFGDHLEMDQYYASDEELFFTKAPQQGQLSVYGNQFMLINTNADWIRDLKPTWGNIQADLTFQLDPNTTGQDRTAEIVVSGDAETTKTIKVTQTAADINVEGLHGSYQATQDQFVDQAQFIREFEDAEWQPLYVPFLWRYEDWSPHFEVAQIEGIRKAADQQSLLLEYTLVKDGNLEAHKPYLVRSKKAGRLSLPLRYVNFFAAAEKTMTWQVDDLTYAVTGTYHQLDGQDVYNHHLYWLQQGKLSTSPDVNTVLPAYRWYLSISDQEDHFVVSTLPIHVTEKGTDPTGIDAATNEKSAAAIYNLKGQQISKKTTPVNGIYIMNGKKKVGR